MKKQNILFLLLMIFSLGMYAQNDSTTSKKRLDFAKTYFELGGEFSPSFSGQGQSGTSTANFTHPASFNPYLTWGAFHFWGHADFYVNFPLSQLNLGQNEETDFQLTHSVVTGARYFPWAYQTNKLRPYLDLSWSGLDFKQKIGTNDDQPLLSKDFLPVAGVGILYGYKDFAIRLGFNYFPDSKWDYPVSKTEFKEINTPNYNFNIGLRYSFDASRNKNEQTNDRWNNYPNLSKLSTSATRSGDFFVGIGPSASFSLAKSTYNQSTFPYLESKMSSQAYFDLAVGYQLNKAGIFSALSFRNPKFETSAYGTTQTIQKTSLALEVNKFLTDYSGFAPYIGLNMAYDQITYSEVTENGDKTLKSTTFEPGLTVGWDIVPGKTEEFLILRTNLRWYPFSEFNVDDKKFDFSQLEYNLIQVIFYPGRFMKAKAR